MSNFLNCYLPRLAVFVAGVTLHLSLFRHGEWDLAVTRICTVYATLWLLGTIYVSRSSQDNFLTAARTITILEAIHVSGIYASMIVYRLFFHRLNIFPGSIWARVSNFYVTKLSAKNFQKFKEVEKLHKQHGDFVRLGPSELSVNHPEAVAAILSSQSPCVKGVFYTVLHPRYSLHLERDKVKHAKRRKVWDMGFSTKSLRDYEPRVAAHTKELLAQIDKHQGKPMDIADWFNFYSFDVMGDLAFGKSFNMVRNGMKHYYMETLREDMDGIGLFSHLMWLFPIFKATPILNASHLRFFRFLHTQVVERIQEKMKPERPDIFSPVLKEYEALAHPTKQDEENLDGDAHLVVVAGSDTTAATLIALFFELCCNSSFLTILRAEVDDYFKTHKEPEAISLSKLKHLDAAINEAMRLHPAVPSGMQRVTPPEGLRVGQTLIPGLSNVQIPFYTLFRDERLFKRPLEFLPERWNSRPDLNIDDSSFVPFSTGPYSCAGRQLALTELRYVTSQIVHLYDFEFAPGFSREKFYSGRKDTFTLSFAQTNLVFSKRRVNEK